MTTTAQHTYQKRRYHQLKAVGQCKDCGKKVEAAGKARCRTCRRNASEAARRTKELSENAAWLALKLNDCLEYDPASGTAEECWERHNARTDEDAWSAASYLVARVNARGEAISAVVNSEKTTGDLVDFAVGDRGERYAVTAFDPVTELRFCYGWADDPRRLVAAIERHPRFQYVWLVDRVRGMVLKR